MGLLDMSPENAYALMATGLAMMGAPRGREWQQFGQAGLLGMAAKQNYLDEIAKRQRADVVTEQEKLNLEQLRRQMAADAAAREYYAKNGPGGAPAALGSTQPPGMPPSTMPAPMTPPALSYGMQDRGIGAAPPVPMAPPQQVPSGAAPSRRQVMEAMVQKMLTDAQNLAAKGALAQAQLAQKTALDLYEKMPKAKGDPVTLTNPVTKERIKVQYFDDGSSEVQPFGPDQEKAHFLDTGSQIGAVDPFTGKPIAGGGLYNKTMTPGEAARLPIEQGNLAVSRGQLGVAQAGLGLRQQELAQGQWSPDLERGLLVNKVTGETKPMTAGGVAVGPKDAQQQVNLARDTIDMTNRVLSDIKDIKPNISNWTAGVGGAMIGKVPGTPAYDLEQRLTSIKANLGFQQLSALRAASPTGGALGQVSDIENKLLQAAVASLDKAQSPDQLRAAIDRVELHLIRVQANIQKGLTAQSQRLGASIQTPSQQQAAKQVADPLGIR